MKKVLPLLLVILLGLALLWITTQWTPQADRGIADDSLRLARPPQGGDFVLSSHNGPVALADFRGRLVVLYFGYTWCPDICPTGLAFISMALDQLTTRQRAGVQVLFVSVDPQRDSVQRLKEYVGYFHDSMIGITGSAQQVAEVAARYGVAYRIVDQQSAAGYAVDHSADMYLVDRDGQLRGSLAHGTAPAQIAAVLRDLLGDQ